jgi:hypothetical protein
VTLAEVTDFFREALSSELGAFMMQIVRICWSTASRTWIIVCWMGVAGMLMLFVWK